jgi:hypothetical protein
MLVGTLSHIHDDFSFAMFGRGRELRVEHPFLHMRKQRTKR